MGGPLIALVWANVAYASYERMAHALHFLVNDVAMAFFFALATKEIVEARSAGGALASPREAAVPLLAAAGGMLVPALLYAGAATVLGHPELVRGWGVPCATDIAFSYLTARLIFPAHHPAIPFLLLLAVADDALGLMILAVFYPSGTLSPLLFVGLIAPAIALAWWCRRRGVASVWPYVLGAGSLSWMALFFGGLHPALALVPIVPFMHVEAKYHELFEENEPRPVDTLNVFAEACRVPVQVVLLFF